MSNQSNFRTEIKRKHSINFLVQTQDDMIFEGRCAKDVNNFLKIWYQFHLCNYNHFDFLNFRRLFCLLHFFASLFIGRADAFLMILNTQIDTILHHSPER